jgi:hypothetical protein
VQVKCANCDRQARYLDEPLGMLPVYYCQNDLPPHLREKASGGSLDIPDDAEDRPEVDPAIQESRRARRKST